MIDGWDESQVAIMSRERALALKRAMATGKLAMDNLRATDERTG